MLKNTVEGIGYMVAFLFSLFLVASAIAFFVMVVGYCFGFWYLAFDGWMLVAIPR